MYSDINIQDIAANLTEKTNYGVIVWVRNHQSWRLNYKDYEFILKTDPNSLTIRKKSDYHSYCFKDDDFIDDLVKAANEQEDQVHDFLKNLAFDLDVRDSSL